jgi:hypothetical protein
MYFDGSLNIDGARVGVYFILPSRDRQSYVLWIHFKASNNTAEYGLCIAVELGIKWLMEFGDYAFVIN